MEIQVHMARIRYPISNFNDFLCEDFLDKRLQVRIAAAESLPHLLECAKIRGLNYFYQILSLSF